MNKEEKEAIERLDRKLTIEKSTKNIGMPVYIKDVELVLNLIQKQEKIIDKMAEELETQFLNYEPCYLNEFVTIDKCVKFENCRKCIKEYFKKEVDKDVKD